MNNESTIQKKVMISLNNSDNCRCVMESTTDVKWPILGSGDTANWSWDFGQVMNSADLKFLKGKRMKGVLEELCYLWI